VGGLKDLVVDGETGLLVPPGDPEALRAALERLLADAELRRRLGAAGRERARERFSWAAVTDATLAAYRMAV
jgi:glycosyltransferase involved in cell wall biosynthesis